MWIILLFIFAFALGFVSTVALLWWLIVPQNNAICTIDGNTKFVPMSEIKISKKFSGQ